ncbi:MAG: ion transporter [Chloroflexota bacterium]|nr:ion transporter [Chloroflexota bacterium]PLS79283.1 MAG: potassium channel protein [Chloroflexota bacterium]
MRTQPEHDSQQQLKHERWALLEQINALTDKPMIVLSFIWLALLILDFTGGLSPFLQTVSYILWGLFILDFAIEFMIAPHKLDYLRRNWLTAVSLLLPPLRILRIFRALRVLRAARALRSISLLRLVTSLNRGMRAVAKTMGRRGIGYIASLTLIVTFAGAAGMYAFESPAALSEAQIEATGLVNYGEAVWWTAMIMTTMGSEYWPKTGEGRILGWLLSLYAFAIFGYITATIASYFVGQDAAGDQAEGTGALSAQETATLRHEIATLQAHVAALTHELQRGRAVSLTSSTDQPMDKR